MTNRNRARRGLALASLLALLGGMTACATPGQKREERHNARLATSHLDIGIDHLENDRTALALREFLLAESLDANNPRIQYALGIAYLDKNKKEESRLHFERALQLEPSYHEARVSLTAIDLADERYQAVLDQCEILLQDPTFEGPWRALANQGWAQYKLGRGREARESLEKALDFNDQYWPAKLSLAIIEAEGGRKLEAIALFKSILTLGPGPGVESEANYRLAEIYINLGKRERAVAYLTASVATAPDGPWAKKSQEYLRLLR